MTFTTLSKVTTFVNKHQARRLFFDENVKLCKFQEISIFPKRKQKRTKKTTTNQEQTQEQTLKRKRKDNRNNNKEIIHIKSKNDNIVNKTILHKS